ncbi:MAG TPA: prepilin-type N-terminal cleavage/methylation domain-containing protein [Gemmatimonadales bacterium]|nr:prepilin-type N-terminal cleavage/methylation domain-containing protein [Gemmatimonadales bacterium]
MRRLLPPVSARRRSIRRIGRRGFSLIEMLTVVVVIGIVVAIALPRINVDAYRVNSAVRAVTVGLSYAQRLAVTLQHDVRVAIDVANNRLRVHEDADNDATIDPGERVTYTNLEEGVIFARGAAPPITYSTGGVGANTVNFTQTQGGLPVVVFRRDGSASENGGFYLNTIRGLAGGSTSWVRAGEIIRSSGRVIWYSYASGAWTRGN